MTQCSCAVLHDKLYLFVQAREGAGFMNQANRSKSKRAAGHGASHCKQPAFFSVVKATKKERRIHGQGNNCSKEIEATTCTVVPHNKRNQRRLTE